jgi:hypothetical protein
MLFGQLDRTLLLGVGITHLALTDGLLTFCFFNSRLGFEEVYGPTHRDSPWRSPLRPENASLLSSSSQILRALPSRGLMTFSAGIDVDNYGLSYQGTKVVTQRSLDGGCDALCRRQHHRGDRVRTFCSFSAARTMPLVIEYDYAASMLDYDGVEV